MSSTLNPQETTALIEAVDFLRAFAESTSDDQRRRLRRTAKAHAEAVNTVVTMKGNYPS